MIYVFLADGFEECEAIAPVDILRRAGLNAITVKVRGGEEFGYTGVVGAHGIELTADGCCSEIGLGSLENLQMVVLPGGKTGVENLYKSENIKKIIGYCIENNIRIGAICAAPSILARWGYLENIRATAYPSFRHYLTENGAILEENEKVVTDGIFTTAVAAGVSIEFGLELVKVLKGEEESKQIAELILL